MIVLSIGGSLISPTDHSGKTIGHIEMGYLKRLRRVILKRVARGEQFIIVTGGGGPSRAYAKAALKLNTKAKEVDRHWIGIAATKLNAEFFRVLFSPLTHAVVLGDPTVHIPLSSPVAIAAGWLPGHSSIFHYPLRSQLRRDGYQVILRIRMPWCLGIPTMPR